MCKFLKRLFCVIVILAIAGVIIAFLRGGEPFRKLGQKSEHLGRTIRKKSEEFAKEADKLKQTRKVIEKQKKEIERLKEKLKSE